MTRLARLMGLGILGVALTVGVGISGDSKKGKDQETKDKLPPGWGKRGADGKTSDRGPGHWPQWRGPDRSNMSRETGLLPKWPEGGPPLVWTASGLGEGVASVAV